MSKSAARYGIRNQLVSDREVLRAKKKPDVSAAGSVLLNSRLPQVSIGRFLIGKNGVPDPDNPVLRVANNLQQMNRHRGTMVDAGRIIMQYQTPDQFNHRVLMRAEEKGYVLKNARHQREHIRDLKEEVREYFEDIADDPTRVDVRTRYNAQEQREKEIKETRKYYIKEGLTVSEEEIKREVDSCFIYADADTRSDFAFVNRISFKDTSIGLRVATHEEGNIEVIEQDLEIVNGALREVDLINRESGPLHIGSLSLQVTLFEAHSQSLADEIYTPYIPMTRTPFENLGIHELK